MNFFFSTSIVSETVTDGGRLIEQLKQFDIAGIELDYRIRPEMVPAIKATVRKHGLCVSSVHNFFPVPEAYPPRPGGGDFFNLAGLDPEERREAVKWSTRTIEMAADFEAPAVVVHCGKVEMDAQIENIRQAFENGTLLNEATQRRIGDKLAETESKKPPHFDALRFSLERLITAAMKQGVRLALENRNHYHELPGLDDLGRLFSEFAGAPIGYWHDTGHEHVMSSLHFYPAGTPLQRFADQLIGIHIHDAAGLSDHLPPGEGETDFTQAIAHLKEPVTGVFELKPGISSDAAAKGIARFRKLVAESDLS